MGSLCDFRDDMDRIEILDNINHDSQVLLKGVKMFFLVMRLHARFLENSRFTAGRGHLQRSSVA